MLDESWMRQALDLAAIGQGSVEPNPMVGCIIVRDDRVLASGCHERFGGPHAEQVALRHAKPEQLAGATWYLNLEPCTHYGKTPPCIDSVLAARPARVVIAMEDPFPQVAGKGIDQLRRAGIEVTVGVEADRARKLNAPYIKRIMEERPWVIAKWAMTLDGKIATRTGQSRWISSEDSRELVHGLRARVDAVIVGLGTATMDDPLLTARLPEKAGEPKRIATRVVFDHAARLSPQSQLVRTAREAPLLIVSRADADPQRVGHLRANGAEVVAYPYRTSIEQVQAFLDNMYQRGMTNLVVEGGPRLMATFFEANAIDEVWAFVAPKLVGGIEALSPIAGLGLERLDQSGDFEPLEAIRLRREILLRTRRVVEAVKPPCYSLEKGS
jgi:diaminohydroxyphosphoribosylaminopyrimidine deaminase/5-amino-6-(5-phosphoribosylamino)uracil reductase